LRVFVQASGSLRCLGDKWRWFRLFPPRRRLGERPSPIIWFALNDRRRRRFRLFPPRRRLGERPSPIIWFALNDRRGRRFRLFPPRRRFGEGVPPIWFHDHRWFSVHIIILIFCCENNERGIYFVNCEDNNTLDEGWQNIISVHSVKMPIFYNSKRRCSVKTISDGFYVFIASQPDIWNCYSVPVENCIILYNNNNQGWASQQFFLNH